MDITTRAVANTGLGAPGLIYVLKKINTGIGLTGGSTLTVNGSLIVNSKGPNPITLSGSKSTITAEGIGVAASSVSCAPGTCTPAPKTNMPQGPDPLASVPPPTFALSCNHTAKYVPETGKTTTINPGVYCGGLKISGKKTIVNFSPGNYIIMNGFEISQSATVTGANVMIYNTGNVTIGGVKYDYGPFTVSQSGTTVELSGIIDSGHGPYEGMVFFQDRNNPNTVDFGSGASVELNGIIYINKAPGATWSYSNSDTALQFQSNSATAANEYTLLVVWSIEFGGGPAFTMYSSFTGGQSPLKHVSLVE
jgi:hypothetical protein